VKLVNLLEGITEMDDAELERRRKQFDYLTQRAYNIIPNHLCYRLWDHDVFVVLDIPDSITEEQEAKLWDLSFTQDQQRKIRKAAGRFTRVTPAILEQIKTHGSLSTWMYEWKDMINYFKKFFLVDEREDDFEEEV